VVLEDGAARYRVVAAHADVVMGPGPVNFSVGGEDVKVSGKAGAGPLAGCAAKLVAFPEH
jgi:hypothetical protein